MKVTHVELSLDHLRKLPFKTENSGNMLKWHNKKKRLAKFLKKLMRIFFTGNSFFSW